MHPDYIYDKEYNVVQRNKKDIARKELIKLRKELRRCEDNHRIKKINKRIRKLEEEL